MLPHEKSLVKRLESEPFALLGINSDGDAEAVNKILSENQITWRQAIEGSTEGPLATRWNVSGWPTIYILDHEGRIRFKDLRDEPMEQAVLKLIAECKAARKGG